MIDRCEELDAEAKKQDQIALCHDKRSSFDARLLRMTNFSFCMIYPRLV